MYTLQQHRHYSADTKGTCNTQLAPGASALPVPEAGQEPLAALKSPVAAVLVRSAAMLPVFVSCTLSDAFAPTRTVPKLSEPGLTARVDGLETPTSEMNSSDVLAFEAISIALTRAPAPPPG